MNSISLFEEIDHKITLIVSLTNVSERWQLLWPHYGWVLGGHGWWADGCRTGLGVYPKWAVTVFL